MFGGDLSRRLLARREDLELTMIDPWVENHTDDYKASEDYHASLHQDQQDSFYDMTKRVTAFAGERARIIRAKSSDACSASPR